jgi:hypothetical protein
MGWICRVCILALLKLVPSIPNQEQLQLVDDTRTRESRTSVVVDLCIATIPEHPWPFFLLYSAPNAYVINDADPIFEF